MRAENFIAFFTVCGFFIGLMFVTLKVDEPIEMMIYTFLITFFFYLLIHIVIMNYIDVRNIFKGHFNKHEYEESADYLITELSVREKRIESMLAKLAVENALIKQTLSNNNGQSKAKAA